MTDALAEALRKAIKIAESVMRPTLMRSDKYDSEWTALEPARAALAAYDAAPRDADYVAGLVGDAPDAIYLTEMDCEDDDYPLVWASISPDSGGVKYIRAFPAPAPDAGYVAGVLAGREEAAAECDRLRESYRRSLTLYDEGDPQHRAVKYSGAAAAVCAENIRSLPPPAAAPAWVPPPESDLIRRDDVLQIITNGHATWCDIVTAVRELPAFAPLPAQEPQP